MLSPARDCYSLRLHLTQFPGMTVAGKGTSEALAEASAYGELMEYVQHRVFPGLVFGLMPASSRLFPDETRSDFATLRGESEAVLRALVEGPLDRAPIPRDQGITCVPFYDVRAGTVAHLPIRLLHRACGTNGMCAGNTPAEALVHGISEVMEHFVVKQIYLEGRLRFPAVPESVLRSLEAYLLVEAIRDRGYQVVVKDCTLGGAFPVLGVVLLHPESGRYRLKLGSDPSMELALQRCLTEAFQGIGEGDVPATWMNRIDVAGAPYADGPFVCTEKNRLVQYLRTMTYGTGDVPREALLARGEPRFESAFLEEHASNRERLTFLVERLLADGRDLYVRDTGFLGFPAYRVYVPEMSEWLPLSHEVLAYDGATLRRCLLRLGEISEDDARVCAGLLEWYRANVPAFHVDPQDHVRQWACVRFTRPTDFDHFRNVDLLLSLLHGRAGDPHQALRALNAYLRDGGNVENRHYLSAVAAFLRLRSDGKSVEEVRRELAPRYGDALADEVVRDMADPEETFDDWVLPRCGDCAPCPVSDRCGFEQWRAVTNAIQERMAGTPLDQAALADLFEGPTGSG